MIIKLLNQTNIFIYLLNFKKEYTQNKNLIFLTVWSVYLLFNIFLTEDVYRAFGILKWYLILVIYIIFLDILLKNHSLRNYYFRQTFYLFNFLLFIYLIFAHLQITNKEFAYFFHTFLPKNHTINFPQIGIATGPFLTQNEFGYASASLVFISIMIIFSKTNINPAIKIIYPLTILIILFIISNLNENRNTFFLLIIISIFG